MKKLISPKKVSLTKVIIDTGDKVLQKGKIFGDIPINILGKEIELQETYQKLYDGSKIFSQQLYVEGKECLNKIVVTAF